MSVNQQLALKVGVKESFNFENFWPVNNEGVVEKLLSLKKEEGFLYLWGSEGTGKSHLLQALCHQWTSADHLAIYLPLKQALDFTPDILEGLEAYDLICLDDIDAIVNIENWEIALFHLFNRMKDGGKLLVISANNAPKLSSFKLKDLESRMNAGLIYQMQALSDEEKLNLIRMRAEQRGFGLDEDALRFIFSRSGRSIEELMKVLDDLDSASLQSKRRVTIPFLKELFSW